MSRTVFTVLPSKITIPTYKEIIDVANTYINDYLLSIGVGKKISISFNLQKTMINELVQFDCKDELVQERNIYAWFFVPYIPGGTGCYYHKNLPIDNEAWEDELKDNTNAKRNEKIIRENMRLGYQWLFRRSAGQPAIIALAYGMLAASLATLVDGIIYSDDGAWDYSMFPAKAEDFLEWYFRPELTANEDCKIFSMDCIKSIRDEVIFT
jgi:hypothetical protein